MTMKPIRSLIALSLLAVALAGCGSKPPTRFHSLLSTAQPAGPENAGLPPMPLDLGAVRVPAAVDQQQWVVRLPDDSLRILEGEQWAAPLRDELRSAIYERLAQRYAAVDARSAPGHPAVRVRIDVQRFESIAGREVWLDATWTAQSDLGKTENGEPATVTCRTSLREAAPGDLPALAAAHRQAVIRLADLIGSRLLSLSNGAATRCP